MRFAGLALVILVLSEGASAIAAGHVSTPGATKACMLAARARFDIPGSDPFSFPETKAELDWIIGPRIGTASSYTYPEVTIYFSADASSAARVERRLMQVAMSFGYFKSEALARIGQLRNVAWIVPLAHAPLTPKQRALLTRCLSA